MNRRSLIHHLGWTLLLSCIYFIGFAQGNLPDDLDAWIESARHDWNIPGMAVGIVKDGEVVYAKGFGEKQLGQNEPVDEHTIFSIASVSKNMTDRKSTRLNSSHVAISYAVFCLKKKKNINNEYKNDQ